MADQNTARVLGLPGGGTRGYMQNQGMNLFCQSAGIPGNQIWKNFDCIGATSVGGLNGLAYAFGLSPDDLVSFYTDESPWIFTIRTALDIVNGSINSSLASNRPYPAQKVIILGQNDQFYNAVDPVNSNYGGARLRSSLESVFGSATMQDLKTNVVIPAYEADTDTYRLFSNLDLPEFIGQNELITNVALATSAAHFYLPPAVFNNHTYLDGGVFQNNATRLALSTVKQIKPLANRFCVFCSGTGLNPDLGLEGTDPDPPFPFEDTVKTVIAAFDAALTGSAESVHTGLFIESQYSLSNLYYYMTRPALAAAQNTELDNTDSDYLAYLINLIENWFNQDSANISNFIGHFIA